MTAGIDRRRLSLGALSVATFAVAASAIPARAPHPAKGYLASSLPKSIADRVSVDVTIDVSPAIESLQGRLYDEIVNRRYDRAGADAIDLLVAYGRDQSEALGAHRQEACYLAQGFKVSQWRQVDLHIPAAAPLRLVEFVAESANSRTLVSYWMTIGKYIRTDKFGRLTALVRQSMWGTIPDGYLVRLSSPYRGMDTTAMAHHRFIGSFVEVASLDLKTHLVPPLR